MPGTSVDHHFLMTAMMMVVVVMTVMKVNYLIEW